MIDVYVSSGTIDLGRQGENDARRVFFSLRELTDLYGEGTATLVHMRPSDQVPYICETVAFGGYVVWTPSSTDTAYSGSGKCELRWVVGDTLAKSIIYTTTIAPSLTGAGEVPSPYQSWYDAIIAYIEANYVANGASVEVREAIYTLLSKAAYTETGLADELAIVQAWTNTECTGLSLSSSSMVFDTVSAKRILATRTPVDCSQEVTWVSSNTAVASVMANSEDSTIAFVAAVGDGTCTITATCGSQTATCVVTVNGVSVRRYITYNLSSVSSSNTSQSVIDESAYSTTLTADSGYVLSTVTVTMGGEDITATVYSSGTITIPSVTGNIVISATAVAAVASLSAVYTQSGTVYEVTSLDSLKSDLVVTATYGDSTTATVPAGDYTLSGTLAVGTSAVTVSYGGKTTTFNAVVSDKVPSGYTAYDYAVAVANNSANSVIDTGIIFNPVGYAYDIKFKWRANTGAGTVANPVMGCRNTNSTTTTDAFAFYCSNNNMGYHLLGNDSGVTLSTSIGTINTVHWNFVDGSDSTLTFNGTTHTIGTLSLSQITSSTKSFCLLGTNKAGTKVNSTNAIYSQLGEVVFYDQNGDIAYYFVPAKNANNEYGFYECIGGNFYGKSSSYVTCGNWD